MAAGAIPIRAVGDAVLRASECRGRRRQAIIALLLLSLLMRVEVVHGLGLHGNLARPSLLLEAGWRLSGRDTVGRAVEIALLRARMPLVACVAVVVVRVRPSGVGFAYSAKKGRQRRP